MAINLPVNPPNTPFIDRGGKVTREWYRYLSYLTSNANQFTGAVDAQYLLTAPNINLASARVLSAGAGISLTLGSGTATLDLTASGVTAGSYGSASETLRVTFDQYGRATSAQAFTLETDNITEGATNLFFTTARARQSVSGGTGIDYSNVTGVIAIADTAVTPGAYGSASQVGTFTVNAQGQLTAAANVAITAAAIGAVPDTRQVIAGAGLTGGGTLAADRTFDVGAGTGITVNANDVALDTVSTRNTDHSGVSIVAGAGLTGGGDITASRTLDIGAGTGITVNANDIAITVQTAYGTYTPTLTNSTNVAASTAYACQYMRVGNTVTVSGRVDIDPTAASTSTVLLMSLPIASNFTNGNANECAGVATGNAVAQSMAIIANVASDVAQFVGLPTSTNNASYFFTFTYTVV